MRLLLYLLLGLLVAGCGGSGAPDRGASMQATLTVTVAWPEPSRFIHQRSDEINVQMSVRGQVLQNWKLAKNQSQPNTSYTFPFEVPTGSVDFFVTAYEKAKPTVTLSRANVSKMMLPGPNQLDFALDSTTTRIEVQKVPDKSIYIIGEAIQFSAVSKNGSGAIVLNEHADFTYSSSNPSVIDPNAVGQATALATGSATVSVRERGNELSKILGVTTIDVSHSEGPPTYSILPVAGLTFFSPFYGGHRINSAGAIVGSQGVYSSGNLTPLTPLPGDTQAWGICIADNGYVMGWSGNGNGHYRSFIMRGGVETDIGNVFAQGPGNSCEALDINLAGDIIGHCQQDAGAFAGFLYSGGSIAFLPTQGTGTTNPFAINNSGDIVGWMKDGAANPAHAFLLRKGANLQDLGTLSGDLTSTAYCINESGMIAGVSVGSARTRCFVWRDGVMQDIGGLVQNSTFLEPHGLNNSGSLVGVGDGGAFLYNQSFGIRRFDTLLDESATGWIISSVDSINDNGVIVGTGWDPSSQFRIFIATPLPSGQ